MVWRREARSRQELFANICAVVLGVALGWGDEDVAIVVSHPPLVRGDVERAFREICEKHQVAGIELSFNELASGSLQAIFGPGRRSPSGRLPPLLGTGSCGGEAA